MPANTTRPSRVPSGWSSTKRRAATCAAVNRFGVTSLEHIDRDTSSVRIIEVSLRDVATSACGRAIATTRHDHRRPAAARRARCGATATVGAPPAWISDRLANVTAYLRRRRRSHAAVARIASGTTSPSSAHGHRKRIVRSPARTNASRGRRPRRNRSEAGTGGDGGDLGLPARDGELQIDGVVDALQGRRVGRGEVRASRCARRRPAAARRRARSPPGTRRRRRPRRPGCRCRSGRCARRPARRRAPAPAGRARRCCRRRRAGRSRRSRGTATSGWLLPVLERVAVERERLARPPRSAT